MRLSMCEIVQRAAHHIEHPAVQYARGWVWSEPADGVVLEIGLFPGVSRAGLDVAAIGRAVGDQLFALTGVEAWRYPVYIAGDARVKLIFLSAPPVRGMRRGI